MTPAWHAASKVDTELPPMPPEAETIAQGYAELIRWMDERSERSLQTEIGSSEIGWECDRRLVYKLAGTPVVNGPGDPWRRIIGTAVHMWAAEKFRKLNRFGWRYLVEYPCETGGVVGHGDLFDTRLHRAVDWKTSTLAKIREMRRRGVPSYYKVQIQHNAAALQETGWQVDEVCLVFLPLDSTLNNIWVWRDVPDRAVVDTAIARLQRLRGADPVTTPVCPSRLCGYCDWYDPDATDPSVACNAKKGRQS